MSAAISADDVCAAAARIAGEVVRTPTAHSQTLSQITGAEVHVKFENLQFTASYKERGALNRLLLLAADCPGVVTASAGNFAQGVAHHATRLGIRAVIVMPATTPMLKIARTSQLGAEVVRHGETFDEANRHAARLAAQLDLVLLSPFDDPEVIAGQGTVALELLADVEGLDVLVVPVGGGGLLAGTAVAARACDRSVELVGVQAARWPAVYNAFHGTDLPVGGATIAEGIAVAAPGVTTVALIRALVDRIELVDEAAVEQAIGLYLEVEKTVSEGAGAAGLAELLHRPERYRGRRVGLVISGGNIDLRQMASVTLRSLVRSGRLTTFWIEVDDRPGRLGTMTTDVGELGGNIVEVVHQRLDLSIHARATEVQLTVETADRDHLHQLLDGLTRRGHRIRIHEDPKRVW